MKGLNKIRQMLEEMLEELHMPFNFIKRTRKIGKNYKLLYILAILSTTIVANAQSGGNSSNVSINIKPVAPPGIASGIDTLLSYIDWGVLAAAIGALLVGILHLTGIMGDSSGAKKFLGGGILALIFWAGLFAFIHGLI